MATEVNKVLIAKGHQPIKDSELVHKVPEKTLKKIHVNASGELIIEG